jgi:hypothetical protein
LLYQTFEVKREVKELLVKLISVERKNGYSVVDLKKE